MLQYLEWLLSLCCSSERHEHHSTTPQQAGEASAALAMAAAALVLTQLTTHPGRASMDFTVSATPAFLLQDKGMDNPLQTPRVSVFPVWGFREGITQCKGPAIMSVFPLLEDIIPLKQGMHLLVMLSINKLLVCKFST